MILSFEPYLDIYTNSYEHIKRGGDPDTFYVSISRTQPKNSRLPRYEKLMPPVQTLFDYKDKKITFEEYTKQYVEMLDKLDPNEVLEDLKKMCGDKKHISLVCWEKTDDKCHRRLAYEWLVINTDTSDQYIPIKRMIAQEFEKYSTTGETE